MVWTPGQSLQSGKYIIDRVLGVGGFGITYLAIQNNRRQNQKSVVIKTLKDEIRHDPRFANHQIKLQQDFLNEALKLAKCHHPHIVEVQEIICEGNLDCIVMEFVQGESLENRLSQQGVLSETEALRYIQQVGEALTVVHGRGLLHRDIKPQNIMIRSGTSEAVLIDFGLAREFIQDLTQTHSIAFTHGFAPPEQYDRRAKRGAYTDIYALAATLYCSLTKHILPPAYMRLSGTALESPKQLNPRISDRVNQAILKGLELKAENRPQSMQEWLSLLKQPIEQPVEPVRNLLQQPEPPYSIPQQNRTPIAQRIAPSQSVPKQSVNSTLQRPLNTAQNRTPAIRRRLRTIPWINLATVLMGYTCTSLLNTVYSVPLWVLAWTLAWTLAWAVAWAVAWVVALALALALALAGSGFWAWAVAYPLAYAVVWTLEQLSESFSRLHTFLVLAGTSIAGLGLGLLIQTLLRSSYPQLFEML